jgi:hypothetical protein
MADELHPEFHAEIITELFETFKCYQTVGLRARLLLHTSSSEHVEAISRHLPQHLHRVLPQRRAA